VSVRAHPPDREVEMAEPRRGATRGKGAGRSPGAGARPRGSAEAGTPGAGEQESRPQPPLCSIGFCPICTFVTAMGEARPELVDHLVIASREVLLAVRSLIDARLEGMPPAPKMERLTIG
jgi:hypothetical protein